MKFKQVELHAFRAYKDKNDGTFDFTLPKDKIANFISIYAPNGFGKTSFYDGVEWALTNNIRRFSERSEIAKEERAHIEKTKGKREKQFILKNKDAGENITGYVEIEIENQDSIRKEIPNASRAGSNDYSFNDKKVKNKYFRDVILSQEGIDSFLREENSKSRYKKFIDFFGNKEDEHYHKKLEELQKVNQQGFDKIKKDIIRIENFLQEEVDKTIFDNSNKEIKQLNEKGEVFLEIGDTFDEKKKLNFDNAIDARAIVLQGNLNKNKSLLELLKSKKNDIDIYFDKKSEEKTINEKVSHLLKVQENQKKLIFYKEKISQDTKQLEEYHRLVRDYPHYKKAIEFIETHNKNFARDTLELEELENLLRTKSIEQGILTREKDRFTSYLSKNTELIKSSPTIFNKIQSLQKEIEATTIFKKEEDVKLEEDRLKLNISQKHLQSKISTLEAVKNNIFLNIRDNGQYGNLIKGIEEQLEKIDLEKEKLLKLEKENKNYEQYDSALRELLTLGSSIINKDKLDTCPLCSQSYNSYNELQTRLLNNPLLADMEQKYLKEKEAIKLLLNKAGSELKKLQESLYAQLNEVLNKLNVDIKSQDYSVKTRESKIGSLQQELESKKLELPQLLEQTNNLNEEDFLASLEKKVKDTTFELKELQNKLGRLELDINNLTNKKDALDLSIKAYKKNIEELEKKEEYLRIKNFKNNFEQEIDVLNLLNESIKLINKELSEKRKTKVELERYIDDDVKKYQTIDLDKEIISLNETIEQLLFYLKKFENFCMEQFREQYRSKEKIEEKFSEKINICNKQIIENEDKVKSFDILKSYSENLLKFVVHKKKKEELIKLKEEQKTKKNIATQLSDEKKNLEKKINQDVESFFHEDLINKIYEKIDPHPDYKNVKFECSFENGTGRLSIFVKNDNGVLISPSLYYSTAQLNVLSLSVFLAKALHAKDDNNNSIDTIFIDDPIQSMDSINVLAIIDLLRSLVINHNKQIILSTHDENFHLLLQKKIPQKYFDSKFIELETFGKVKAQ